MMSINDSLFRIVVRSWAGYHRFCCTHILRIRLDPGPIAPRGGVLYAIRHESFFEAIDLPYYFNEPVVFAKYELMRIPLWGVAAERYGVVGVEREAGARALRAMLTAARKLAATGRPLVIFPEGTRIPHGQQAPLQSGFAGIYKLLGMPIIPVAVDSGPLYHRRWKQSGTIHYRYGEEIPPGLLREEVEARVQTAINALNGERPPA
jgi:1-acyl-sn-glycerol-3-phosphate acyltransferase